MDRMQVFVNANLMGNAAAEITLRIAEESIAARGTFRIAVSGGSMPLQLSPGLRAEATHDFSKWHVYFADERCVADDSKDRTMLSWKNNLFDHVRIPAANIHNLNLQALAESVDAAAQDYERDLKRSFNLDMDSKEIPCLDLVLLGMGPDGHTCSLFPGHPLLQERSRLIAPITDSPKPPPERITFTMPLIEAARNVYFMVAGADKAATVKDVLQTKSHNYPSQTVTDTCSAHWLLDLAAAAELDADS
eukprot:TRINITY_DN441_c0_g1_i1.p1 TRINITY_DN441_c0_g1~~TRINITY_DN441_c0_g1_i1.p1  ORF type:complete len:278 (-),score=89.64 TRINITY_DN441_c0_g1_i1:84-827(-)